MGMDEYIRKESAISIFRAKAEMAVCTPAQPYFDRAAKMLELLPAADVAPVRHGRWIEPTRLYYGAKQYECSLCCSDTFWKKHSITEKYPCCPNCGCRMDGDKDEA